MLGLVSFSWWLPICGIFWHESGTSVTRPTGNCYAYFNAKLENSIHLFKKISPFLVSFCLNQETKNELLCVIGLRFPESSLQYRDFSLLSLKFLPGGGIDYFSCRAVTNRHKRIMVVDINLSDIARFRATFLYKKTEYVSA